MDPKLPDAAAALVRHLGYLRTRFRHLLVHHIEEKRLEPEEIPVRPGLHRTMRGDQCLVSLHILARTEKPEESGGTRGGKPSTRWWFSTAGGFQSD